MEKHFYYLLVIVFCTSCNSKPQSKVEEEKAPVTAVADQELIGFWVGDFKAVEFKADQPYTEINKINIAIKTITRDSVYGQSIVAGNSRPIMGKIRREGDKIFFTLTEPSDDKYDGEFEFEYANGLISGTWTAFNKTLAVTKRSYELSKKQFTYVPTVMLDTNDYSDYYNTKTKTITDTLENGEIIKHTDEFRRKGSEKVYTINSSIHVFTEDELKNYKKIDLEILRNTIFARHGYSFKEKIYRNFFDNAAWYIPVSNDIKAELTVVEKENIKLFKKFEKYATDNYDTYGR